MCDIHCTAQETASRPAPTTVIHSLQSQASVNAQPLHAPLTTGYSGLKECILQMPNPPVISTYMKPCGEKMQAQGVRVRALSGCRAVERISTSVE